MDEFTDLNICYDGVRDADDVGGGEDTCGKTRDGHLDVDFELLGMENHHGIRNADVLVEDEDEDGEFGEDDKEDQEVDPPEGFIRIRPSKFRLIPSTVFVEYPRGLQMLRADHSALESLQHKKMHYQSQWARNCIKNAFTRAGFTESNSEWTAMWAKHQSHIKMRGLNCLQKVNHFPGSWALGRKDRLSRTIWAMRRLYPSEFNFHPESFVLPTDNHCLERCAKMDVFHNKKASSKNKRYWIIKPVASSCGKGIKVISAEKALALGRRNDKKMLVQRYVANPYLINQKKFDMRLYVLVTGVDPLRIYLHGEGLIRIATENFTVKNLKNQFVHLTNYSINKKSKHFCAASKFNNFSEASHTNASANDQSRDGQEGFKWTLHAFKAWLAEQESPEVMENTMSKVNALIVKTILAAEPDLSHSLHAAANYRTNCFELFGFDVLLDQQLTPHLIEVNVSPSLAGSSPLDNYIKGVLVADVCHVTGFHPHDDETLNKYHTNSSAGTLNNTSSGQFSRPSSSAAPSNYTAPPTAFGTDDKDEVNPFSFASLSKLMAGQDSWRKDMTMQNINLAALGNGDAAWYMLLMVEDEFDRAEQSKFRRLHPAENTVDLYIELYKNARFSDQLLGKWLKGGMSGGKENNKFLPTRFIRNCNENSTASDDHIVSTPRGTGVALARSRARSKFLLTGRCASLPPPGTNSDNCSDGDSSPIMSSQVHFCVGKELTEVRTRGRKKKSADIPHYNMNKNFMQQRYDLFCRPVHRQQKVYLKHKVNRQEHATVVFEPSNRRSPDVMGDMYKQLLNRNLRNGGLDKYYETTSAVVKTAQPSMPEPKMKIPLKFASRGSMGGRKKI